MSGYLRSLRGRLLSYERFSEVFALWVFALEPFPAHSQPLHTSAGRGERTPHCQEKVQPDTLPRTLGHFASDFTKAPGHFASVLKGG